MDTPFGYLLSPNITPDSRHRDRPVDRQRVLRALHDGVNRRGQDMYPAMPYTFYTKVTRADSDSIFAYLAPCPPVRNAVNVNQLRFPFDQRWSMMGWRELFFTAGSIRARSARIRRHGTAAPTWCRAWAIAMPATPP